MTECDHWLTLELDLSSWRVLTPLLVHRKDVLPIVPTGRSGFEDAVLREQYVIETIWMGKAFT